MNNPYATDLRNLVKRLLEVHQAPPERGPVGVQPDHVQQALGLLRWIRSTFNDYDLGAWMRVLYEIIDTANGSTVETWTMRTPSRIITRVLAFLLQMLRHLEAETNCMTMSMHGRRF